MIDFRVAACLVACGVAVVACGETKNNGKDDPMSASGSSGATTGGSSSGSAGTLNGGTSAGGNANTAGNSGSAGTASGGTPGAGAEGGFWSNVPDDDRPPRPDWDPPFPVGEPGWQDSEEPLCEHHQGMQDAFDVWADDRGVYGIFSAVCNVLANVPCGKQGLSLQHNDGTGWKLLYALPPGPGMGSRGSLSLTGFEAGPLLVTGDLDGKAGVWQVESNGEASLKSEEIAGRPFVVSKDLAYALSATAVHRFADGEWSELQELPFPAESVWASEDVVVVVGRDQSVYMSNGDQPLAQVPGVPAANYSAVWAFGADDIWAGDYAGRLAHYDGQTWETVETGSKDNSGGGIRQLWGSDDGQLFFRTFSEMGRWNGSKVELLLAPPAGADSSQLRVSTSGLWGRSSKEVFLAVADRTFRDYQCGGQFMLWFDGEQFHSF